MENMKAVRFGGNKYGDDDSPQSRTKSGKEWNPKQAGGGGINANRSGYFDKDTGEPLCSSTANKKSVWAITTKGYSEAHFATFPPEIPETCIKAGCPEMCCSACGKPWRQLVDRIPAKVKSPGSDYGNGAGRNDGNRSMLVGASSVTIGVEPDCKCNAPAIGGTVLDPFNGAGTTGLVATRLGRNYIGIELNPEYIAMATKRIEDDAPLFNMAVANGD
jgi:hypothetical protein